MRKTLSALTFASAALALASTHAVAGSDTKVALVPGGPHPYFAAWEQAGADAVKDFGIGAGDYRVPQKWELSQQTQLLESLLSQGYNSFLIFPGDAVGTNTAVQEITENGGQALALAGCLKDPTPALFCMGTDTGNSAYLGTKELIKAMGGKGRIAHFTGFLVDPNTQLRIDAGATIEPHRDTRRRWLVYGSSYTQSRGAASPWFAWPAVAARVMALAEDPNASSAELAKVLSADQVLTASGGSVGPFRYLVIFDDTGAVTQVVRIGRNGGALGADIPHGTWHTVVALEPDSVFLEAKAGPYRPLSEAERAPWAPAEGAPEAPAYFEALQQRITGND